MNYIDILDQVRRDGAIPREELEALLAWVLSEEGRRSVEREVLADWNAFDAAGTYDYHSLLDRINRRIDALPAGKRVPWLLRRHVRLGLEAAVVLLAVGGAMIFLPRAIENNYSRYVASLRPEKVEVYNPKGLRATITLPDSSRVTLNADSRISYSREFLPGRREVCLEGEAFFEVAKDPRRPFIVHTDAAQMTVLGTSFNVRSYPETGYVATTLVEGSLRVETAAGKYLLEPGDQSRVDKASRQGRVQAIDTDEATGWLDGKFYFRLTPFPEIVTALERAFNVNIRVENKALSARVFTGKFESGENLEQILEVLTISTSFTSSYSKETNTITIR